jgi:hypothetical protein
MQKKPFQVMHFFCWLIFVAIFRFGCASAADWDLEYWQLVNWKNWESGPYKLYTIGEVRVHQDISKCYFYRIAENFAYRALPWLDLEAHYSFIYHKSLGATEFTRINRLELEANPFFEFEDGTLITWRNRLELLKRQNVKHIQFIFRDRITIRFPITGYKYLKAISLYDEVFYNFDHHKFYQNRFVPLMLTISLNRNVDLDAYFMIRTDYSFSLVTWYRSWVIGSVLNF